MHYACVRLNQGLDIVKLYLRAGKEHRLTEDAVSIYFSELQIQKIFILTSREHRIEEDEQQVQKEPQKGVPQ